MTKFMPALTGHAPPGALQNSIFPFRQDLVVWVLLHQILYHHLNFQLPFVSLHLFVTGLQLLCRYLMQTVFKYARD